MTNIVGPYGLSASNRYQISFNFSANAALSVYLGVEGVINPETYERNDLTSNGAKLSYLADEVNIPGFSISTGDFEGHMPGMNQKYAHTKTFRDFTITFLMDHEHLPMNMLHKWAEYMFPFQTGIPDITARDWMLTRYYKDYVCDMTIEKTEPEYSNRSNKVPSKSTIQLYNVFPYLINDLTVSNGPNQPLRLQASFYYEYSRYTKRLKNA